MSLNNIDLPGKVIAHLYKTLQVDEENSYTHQSEKPIDIPKLQTETGNGLKEYNLKFLGNNAKNITIITSHETAVYLPDEELTFLTGILVACKLTLADVAIINFYHQAPGSYKELLSSLKSQTVILFGVQPEVFGLPLSFPYFQVQPFANTSFLYSPALKELANDKILKSKLWVCLRRIFGI